jgi:uracil-DNA glycosylase
VTTIEQLRAEAADCRACHLWERATQTVFGDGASDARVMLVGEQPGDQEDLSGEPFVGPAGRELDRALEEARIDRRSAYVTNVVKHFKFEERGKRGRGVGRIHATPKKLEAAGIARAEIYVTNAVKHFKWKPQGRRRLHQKPTAEEIAACAPWLDAEIATVRPAVVVCLGATAAQALLGRAFRVTRQRGELHEGPHGTTITATVHPSSILRARTDDDRHDARAAFTADLRVVAEYLK